MYFRSFKSINANALGPMLGKINLIDVREVYEYKQGHVPFARNIPMDYLITSPGTYLDKSREYYIICQSGARSLEACSILANYGYNVINVTGGTSAYKQPLVRL